MKAQTGHRRAIAAVVKGEVSDGAHLKAQADAIKAISEMAGEAFPEAAKLAEVAGNGDLKAIGAQLGNLGRSCGGCHKPYRKEK